MSSPLHPTHLGSKSNPMATYVVADPTVRASPAPQARKSPEELLTRFKLFIHDETCAHHSVIVANIIQNLGLYAEDSNYRYTKIDITALTLPMLEREYGSIPARYGVIDHPTQPNQLIVCGQTAWIVTGSVEGWRAYAKLIQFPV